MDFELPLGFGMALAQNEAAMKAFEALTDMEKQDIIRKTHSVRSKSEMQQLVAGIGTQSGTQNSTQA
ncbi:MAG: YdeI/OmpD-associated family protein [Oscillospiraceae bacterium]